MNQQLTILMAELFRMQESEITDTLTMKDTEIWDSLKHMELIVSIEEEFNVQLTADEIVNMLNVKEIKQILEKRGIKN